MLKSRLTACVFCLFVLSFLLAPSPARTAKTQGGTTNVKEQSFSKWDSLEGIPSKQVPGANLGAISFEVMDDNQIAFLCNSTSEIIIVNRTSGKAIKRFDVSFSPRDFSYSDGYFFVLTDSQVVLT